MQTTITLPATCEEVPTYIRFLLQDNTRFVPSENGMPLICDSETMKEFEGVELKMGDFAIFKSVNTQNGPAWWFAGKFVEDLERSFALATRMNQHTYSIFARMVQEKAIGEGVIGKARRLMEETQKFLDAGYTPDELTIVYSVKGETVQPAKCDYCKGANQRENELPTEDEDAWLCDACGFDFTNER